ncbi:MAG: diaminopimelate epimerase [Promethearchaeota archaeon]
MILENLNFEKIHGLGNDYIIINDIHWRIPEEKKSDLAKKLCKVHFSIGADGLIYACSSEKADIKMRIFNGDGSEAEMCGNGIRCFSKYVYENELVKKPVIQVETLKGIIIAELSIVNNEVKRVKIDMGPPILKCEDIPVISTKKEGTCFNEPIKILDKTFKFSAVSMGNPHVIIFTERVITDDNLKRYGSLIESHERFPRKTNVEFVKIISENETRLRVYERGVGITNSCGTGTCAAVVAGVMLGNFKKNVPITVHNDGGDLIVTYTGDTVLMEGPVERAFKGTIKKIII